MSVPDLRVDYIDALTGEVFDLETYDFEDIGDSIRFTNRKNPDNYCAIRKDEIRIAIYEAGGG